jgi:DNA-binding IclR family transcriptional regulator
VLDVLLEAYPMPLTKAEVALRSRYSPRSSSYEVYLARLKRVGLIEFDGKYYRASASLFTETAA